MNAPCLFIKKWPEDGSLELKHVANYVLMIMYIYIYVYICIYIHICCVSPNKLLYLIL